MQAFLDLYKTDGDTLNGFKKTYAAGILNTYSTIWNKSYIWFYLLANSKSRGQDLGLRDLSIKLLRTTSIYHCYINKTADTHVRCHLR